MDQENILDLEKLFLALADKTRLRLLKLMADGEVSVGYLASRSGESQPKTSRHLAYLRNAGLVDTRRDGKWIYYFIKTHSNSAAEGVLWAILDKSGSSAPTRSTFEREGAAVSDDISEKVNMSEFRPNEMDVFLL
jgi:DNA-binding transcriptional ArsR family regulator